MGRRGVRSARRRRAEEERSRGSRALRRVSSPSELAASRRRAGTRSAAFGHSWMSQPLGCDVKEITGSPDPKHISTSYVEPQNLTMRMSMRRFPRCVSSIRGDASQPAIVTLPRSPRRAVAPAPRRLRSSFGLLISQITRAAATGVGWSNIFVRPPLLS